MSENKPITDHKFVPLYPGTDYYCGFGVPRQTFTGDPSWPTERCMEPESAHVPAADQPKESSE